MKNKALLILMGVTCLVAAVPVRADHNPLPPPTPDEIDAQYAAVLSQMKHPQATGVLVTEVGPQSPAGAAGLKAGDIIVRLAAQDVRKLKALRQVVSDLLATNLTGQNDETVVLAVRRAVAGGGGTGAAKDATTPPEMETVDMQVPREPLGIRCIEVEAAIAAPLNPPISERGSVAMAWDKLRELQNAPGGGGDLGRDAFLRDSEEDGMWLGWQKRTVKAADDDTLSGVVEMFHVGAQGDGQMVVARSEAVTFRLRTGDYSTTPPFLLESAEVITKVGEESVETVTAVRAGGVFRTTAEIASPQRTEALPKRERACPLGALVPNALPLVAAALPQRKDAVIPLDLMSVRDFVARPGYVLATRGKEALPGGKNEARAEAWRVDLLHCGVVIESYWLSDQRKLLRVDSFGGTILISRRVPTEAEASSVVAEKPVPMPLAPASQP